MYVDCVEVETCTDNRRQDSHALQKQGATTALLQRTVNSQVEDLRSLPISTQLIALSFQLRHALSGPYNATVDGAAIAGRWRE